LLQTPWRSREGGNPKMISCNNIGCNNNSHGECIFRHGIFEFFDLNDNRLTCTRYKAIKVDKKWESVVKAGVGVKFTILLGVTRKGWF